MKKFRLLGLLLLGSVTAWNTSLIAGDRLFEVDPADFPRYRARLVSKLGSTPFNYGRMIVPFGPHPPYSVSVYSESLGLGKDRYLVTTVAADRSLWNADEARSSLQGAEIAKTHRIDCEIPKELAEIVKQAWLGMLSGDQHPIPIPDSEIARVTHGTVVEFSLQLPDSQALYGWAYAEMMPGWRTRQLLEIANALIAYCKAKPGERPAIATKIDRQASQLLEELTRK